MLCSFFGTVLSLFPVYSTGKWILLILQGLPGNETAKDLDVLGSSPVQGLPGNETAKDLK